MTIDDAAVAAVEARFRRARAPVPAAGVSFAVEEGVDDDTELRALIDEAEADPLTERTRWNAACSDLAAFLRRVEVELTHAAAVEEDAVSTRMGWGGETRVVIRDGASPRALRAHSEAVRTEATRRLVAIRLFATTAAAAARIAALMSTTGGAILALPVAWRLVRTVTEEAKQFNP